jgi:hypothetical protein
MDDENYRFMYEPIMSKVSRWQTHVCDACLNYLRDGIGMSMCQCPICCTHVASHKQIDKCCSVLKAAVKMRSQ